MPTIEDMRGACCVNSTRISSKPAGSARGLRYCNSALVSEHSALLLLGRTLVGRADHDQAAVEAGHGAADEQQVVAAVEADDLKVADGNPRVAVAAGHADALLRPAAAAVAGVGGDRAALPRTLLDAVAVPQPAEPVALDDAGG